MRVFWTKFHLRTSFLSLNDNKLGKVSVEVLGRVDVTRILRVYTGFDDVRTWNGFENGSTTATALRQAFLRDIVLDLRHLEIFLAFPWRVLNNALEVVDQLRFLHELITELLTHVVDAYLLVDAIFLATFSNMVRVKGRLETWSKIITSFVADSLHLIRSFHFRFTSNLASGGHNFDV